MLIDKYKHNKGILINLRNLKFDRFLVRYYWSPNSYIGSEGTAVN